MVNKHESQEAELITIGVVAGPTGLQGLVKVDVLTDFPERFAEGKEVIVKGKQLTMLKATWYKKQVIVKFNGVDSREDADTLRGAPVEIPLSDAAPLPEGQYYHFQIIGLEVRTTDGRDIGKVVEILTLASNDVYVVRGEQGEVLIPAIADVVKSIDPDKGFMVIEPIKGLLSD